MDSAKEVHRLLESLKKNFQCTICLELLSQPISTKCNHQFCRACFDELSTRNAKKKKALVCPLCNLKINKRGVNADNGLSKLSEGVRNVLKGADSDCINLGISPLLSTVKKKNEELKENSDKKTRKKRLEFVDTKHEKEKSQPLPLKQLKLQQLDTNPKRKSKRLVSKKESVPDEKPAYIDLLTQHVELHTNCIEEEERKNTETTVNDEKPSLSRTMNNKISNSLVHQKSHHSIDSSKPEMNDIKLVENNKARENIQEKYIISPSISSSSSATPILKGNFLSAAQLSENIKDTTDDVFEGEAELKESLIKVSEEIPEEPLLENKSDDKHNIEKKETDSSSRDNKNSSSINDCSNVTNGSINNSRDTSNNTAENTSGLSKTSLEFDEKTSISNQKKKSRRLRLRKNKDASEVAKISNDQIENHIEEEACKPVEKSNEGENEQNKYNKVIDQKTVLNDSVDIKNINNGKSLLKTLPTQAVNNMSNEKSESSFNQKNIEETNFQKNITSEATITELEKDTILYNKSEIDVSQSKSRLLSEDLMTSSNIDSPKPTLLEETIEFNRNTDIQVSHNERQNRTTTFNSTPPQELYFSKTKQPCKDVVLKSPDKTFLTSKETCIRSWLDNIQSPNKDRSLFSNLSFAKDNRQSLSYSKQNSNRVNQTENAKERTSTYNLSESNTSQDSQINLHLKRKKRKKFARKKVQVHENMSNIKDIHAETIKLHGNEPLVETKTLKENIEKNEQKSVDTVTLDTDHEKNAFGSQELILPTPPVKLNKTRGLSKSSYISKTILKPSSVSDATANKISLSAGTVKNDISVTSGRAVMDKADAINSKEGKDNCNDKFIISTETNNSRNISPVLDNKIIESKCLNTKNIEPVNTENVNIKSPKFPHNCNVEEMEMQSNDDYREYSSFKRNNTELDKAKFQYGQKEAGKRTVGKETAVYVVETENIENLDNDETIDICENDADNEHQNEKDESLNDEFAGGFSESIMGSFYNNSKSCVNSNDDIKNDVYTENSPSMTISNTNRTATSDEETLGKESTFLENQNNNSYNDVNNFFQTNEDINEEIQKSRDENMKLHCKGTLYDLFSDDIDLPDEMRNSSITNSGIHQMDVDPRDKNSNIESTNNNDIKSKQQNLDSNDENQLNDIPFSSPFYDDENSKPSSTNNKEKENKTSKYSIDYLLDENSNSPVKINNNIATNVVSVNTSCENNNQTIHSSEERSKEFRKNLKSIMSKSNSVEKNNKEKNISTNFEFSLGKEKYKQSLNINLSVPKKRRVLSHKVLSKKQKIDDDDVDIDDIPSSSESDKQDKEIKNKHITSLSKSNDPKKEERRKQREGLAKKLKAFVADLTSDMTNSADSADESLSEDEKILMQSVFKATKKLRKKNKVVDQNDKMEEDIELLDDNNSPIEIIEKRSDVTPNVPKVLKHAISPTTPLTSKLKPISQSTAITNKNLFKKPSDVPVTANKSHDQLDSSKYQDTSAASNVSKDRGLKTNPINATEQMQTDSNNAPARVLSSKTNSLNNSAQSPHTRAQSPHTTTNSQGEEEKNQTHPVVITSRLSSKHVHFCEMVLKKFGGRYCQAVDSDVSHLIVLTDENGCLGKKTYTYKYLMALVSQIWIVDFKWILESGRNGRYLDEEKFEAKGDPASGHENIPKLYRKFGEKSQALFDGYRLCLLGKFQETQISKEQLTKLLSKLSCDIAFSIDEVDCSSSQITTLLVTDNLSQLSSYERYRIKSQNLPCIHPEWIVESIINFKIQDLNKFSMQFTD